ncbi:MAG: hypothetical protein AB1696_09755 [Planctomycetota bacterium]
MRKLLLAGLVALCVGCTTAAKQALYTAAGPQGAYLVIEAGSESPLAAYDQAEVALFANDLPGIIDNSLVLAVQSEIVTVLSEKAIFLEVKAVPSYQQGKTDSPTVVIRGHLVDITSDKIPGQKLIGGGNHLIAVVEMVDKSSGKVLAKANLRGVVKSVVEVGERHLAVGMAKAAEKLCHRLRRGVKE